jgi:type II secretory pathway pseudopilin PulG
LVVIIIIGILSAIALPSFLSQANKAKQSEAKTYIGSLNKSQQAFYVENTAFSASISELGVGIQTKTTNYEYACSTGATGGSCNANAYGAATSSLRSYGGLTYLIPATATVESTTSSIICETDAVNNSVTFVATVCPAGSSSVGT